MEEHEALQFELESLLYTKSESELKEFAASIKIDKDLSNASKFLILKHIQKDLNARLDVDGEISEKVSWLKESIAILKPREQGDENEQANEIIKLQQEIEALKEKQQVEMSGLMTKLTLLESSNTEKIKSINEIKTPSVDTKCTKTENTAMPSNSLVRREFKMSGQIGEPGQADKLTFVSLTHQIRHKAQLQRN